MRMGAAVTAQSCHAGGPPRKSSGRTQTNVDQRRPNAGQKVAAAEPPHHPPCRASPLQLALGLQWTANPSDRRCLSFDSQPKASCVHTPCRALWGCDDKDRLLHTGTLEALTPDCLTEFLKQTAECTLVPLRGQDTEAQGGSTQTKGHRSFIHSFIHSFSCSVSHRVVEIFQN